MLLGGNLSGVLAVAVVQIKDDLAGRAGKRRGGPGRVSGANARRSAGARRHGGCVRRLRWRVRAGRTCLAVIVDMRLEKQKE